MTVSGDHIAAELGYCWGCVAGPRLRICGSRLRRSRRVARWLVRILTCLASEPSSGWSL